MFPKSSMCYRHFMADLKAFYRVYLKTEFQNRSRKNTRYSLRAFAKSLAIDNGQLSKILSGNILLSVDLAAKIAEKLHLSGSARADFLISAAEEQKCHALYLIDPALTDCDLKEHKMNLLPLRKTKRGIPK
jgi:transcriptional regulator with XRE-family HTH domain